MSPDLGHNPRDSRSHESPTSPILKEEAARNRPFTCAPLCPKDCETPMPTTLLSALALTIAAGTSAGVTDTAVPDTAALLAAEREARASQVLCYPADLTPEERQRIIDRY